MFYWDKSSSDKHLHLPTFDPETAEVGLGTVGKATKPPCWSDFPLWSLAWEAAMVFEGGPWAGSPGGHFRAFKQPWWPGLLFLLFSSFPCFLPLALKSCENQLCWVAFIKQSYIHGLA